MKGVVIFILFTLTAVAVLSFSGLSPLPPEDDPAYIAELRRLYSMASDKWPAATLDSGIALQELAMLPESPIAGDLDSLKDIIELGKTLFFDPRLSGVNQVSCSSCHAPDMHWTDGRHVAIGQDQLSGVRNTPTIENIWVYDSLFWDGRAQSPEQQSLMPIENPVEMHQTLTTLSAKLAAIKGYKTLFLKAFGNDKINSEKIAKAFAIFEMSVTSGQSDFDRFLAGNSTSLDDEEVLGLHIYRTKARCMNCHNGPYMTDGQFHNLGFVYYNDPKLRDLGLYATTKNPEDVGKFKTPGLRNVMLTGPWFHNGIFKSMISLMNNYNSMMGNEVKRRDQENDPLFPKIDPHIKSLALTTKERNAVIAFMDALSTNDSPMEAPVLPQ